MLISLLRRLLGMGGAGPRPRRRRGRLIGCLPWIMLLIVALVIASLLFGGFQKGTKAGLGAAGLGAAPSSMIAAWR